MQRRKFLELLGGGLAAAPLSAYAQPVEGRPLIGWLSPSTAVATARIYQGLKDGLHELGYREGRTIWHDVRYADGVLVRLPTLAAELVARKPDVLIAGSTPSTVAAHRATQMIPIVMITLVDPVSIGVVKSIARPGGNVTGIWTFGGQDALIGKRIGLLKEIEPAMSRLGVMIASGDATNAVALNLLPKSAGAVGVSTKVYEIRSEAEIDTMFMRAAADRMQGIFVHQSPFFLARRSEVAASAARSRIPTVYGYREHAESGGLIAYGSSLSGAYRQAARLVDKILKGAKPAELPVEQADKYELVVNNQAAKALGLKIPESFLLRADAVIE